MLGTQDRHIRQTDPGRGVCTENKGPGNPRPIPAEDFALQSAKGLNLAVQWLRTQLAV